MERSKLWARHGEAVRQAIAWGEMAHSETASEACTEAFLRCAIARGLVKNWAGSCPEPRGEPERARAGSFPAPSAARFAGLDSLRQAGAVLRSARV